VINCRTEEEIVSSVKRLMADRTRHKIFSEALRDCIKRRYASRETVRLQLEKYGEFIESKVEGRSIEKRSFGIPKGYYRRS